METQKDKLPENVPQEIVPAIEQPPVPRVRKPTLKPKRKNITDKRVSNRRYPERNCQKADCNKAFIPTDSRHRYCSEQHRIDQNNDLRKAVDKIESAFKQQAKKNRAILIKIFNSKEYEKRNVIHVSVLDYEGYDFNVYHNTLIQNSTSREVKICYDYGVVLADSEKQLYKILNKQQHEF